MINGDYDHHVAQVQHDEQKLQTRNSGPTVYQKTYDTNPSRELTCLTSLKGKMHLPKPL